MVTFSSWNPFDQPVLLDSFLAEGAIAPRSGGALGGADQICARLCGPLVKRLGVAGSGYRMELAGLPCLVMVHLPAYSTQVRLIEDEADSSAAGPLWAKRMQWTILLPRVLRDRLFHLNRIGAYRRVVALVALFVLVLSLLLYCSVSLSSQARRLVDSLTAPLMW